MKTSELTGAALDWAVATIEHPKDSYLGEPHIYSGNANKWWIRIPDKKSRSYTLAKYSTSWSQGGPIIEQESLSLRREPDGGWYAFKNFDECPLFPFTHCSGWDAGGETPLVAAMRCYVASKLGEEVEIPAELQSKS